MTTKPEPLGTVLDGRYRVGRRLDRGGPGGVYEGESLANDRKVAIELLAGKASDPARFDKDAAAAGKIDDKHCVGVIDSGIEGGTPFLVMDLVKGTSLAEEIRGKGRMGVPRAISILRQLLRGLKHAHGLGFVHGGITTRGVFLVDGEGIHEVVRILGWGLGRRIGHRDDPAPELVKNKALRGDPAYLAPEQVRGDKIDARTDLYAVSVILFELLAGRPPFAAGQPVTVLNMHLSQAVPVLAEGTGPSFVPPEIDALVRCGLAKDAADRPQTAEEYLHAVEACMAVVSARDADTTTRIAGMSDRIPRLLKLSRSAVGVNKNDRSGRGGLLGFLIVLLVLAGAGAAVYTLTRDDPDAPSAPAKPGKRDRGVAKPTDDPPKPVRAGAPDAAAQEAPTWVWRQALDEAIALTRARRYDAAERKLAGLVAEYPDAADIRRELGHLYVARNWPEPALKAYRAALAKDPKLRADPTIIKSVISLLDSGSRGWDAAKFLEENVGAIAIAPLTDTVLNDPSSTIRDRAKAVLDKLKAAKGER